MKLTKEEKERIIELRKAGHSFRSIAKEIGIDFAGIKRIWYAYEIHGIEGVTYIEKKKYSAEIKYEIINRIKNGETRTRLAAEYNIPGGAGTITGWMQKYEELGYNGLITKKRGRPKMQKEEKKEIEPSHLNDKERQELIELRGKNKYLEMENEYLKKLDALVQERLKQERKRKSK